MLSGAMMRPSLYATRSGGIASLVFHDRLGNYPGCTGAASTRLPQSSFFHVLCPSRYALPVLGLGGISLAWIQLPYYPLRRMVHSRHFVAYQGSRLRRTLLENIRQTLQRILDHGSRFASRGRRRRRFSTPHLILCESYSMWRALLSPSSADLN